MRNFFKVLFVATTVLSVAAGSALAQQAKPSKLFTKPPLGLGADIPDDLLFSGDEDARWDAQTNRENNLDDAADGSEWNTEVHKNPSYRDDPFRSDISASGCLARSVVMASLADDGWHDFRRLSLRPRTLAFNARRGRGQMRRLQVGRCSGRIVHESAAYSD